MKILVTGGAGYIGSHTIVELVKAGHEPVIVDNLCNSDKEVLNRLKTITGKDIPFYQADIRDEAGLEPVFEKERFEAVIHFAGLKAVGESVEKPWEYYENNIGGTLRLLNVMKRFGVKNIIFSSSATVYGDPDTFPCTEESPKKACTNPYGWTKWMQEQILEDIQKADPSWNVVILRYFNPIGAHESGLIGEDPTGIPNNLLPYVTQTAVGIREKLTVFGNDYATPDGTCIRDYIHVMDLATGHTAALKKIGENCGFEIYNLGTGKGTSVLELVHAFEEANGIKVPYVIGPRRAGDIDCNYGDPAKAYREMGWKAVHTIEESCRDSWNWQKKNPHGYKKA